MVFVMIIIQYVVRLSKVCWAPHHARLAEPKWVWLGKGSAVGVVHQYCTSTFVVHIFLEEYEEQLHLTSLVTAHT